MRLLLHATDNPIGKQDYVSWFQIGYLRWKHLGDLAQAEEAFRRAVRLSEPSADQYFSESVRHLAHIRYLQHAPQEALEILRRIEDKSPDAEVRYELARYAAVSGRPEEAISWLERAIEAKPTTILAMFVEPDFSGMRDLLEGLAARLLTRAQKTTAVILDRWASVTAHIQMCAREAELVIEMPPRLVSEVEDRKRRSVSAGYIDLLALNSDCLWPAKKPFSLLKTPYRAVSTADRERLARPRRACKVPRREQVVEFRNGRWRAFSLDS